MSRPVHLLSYLALPIALVVLGLGAPRAPVEPPGLRFDGDRALADVRAMANDCPERRPDRPCHRRAAAYVSQELRFVKLAASDARFEGGVNVLADDRGSRPGVVVLAAHYDSVAGSPGAVDDASGVAVVLEVARVLRRWDAPRRTIRYAIFDREEDGLLGSKAYVSSLSAVRRQEIEAAIAVEMPGFRGGSPVVHTFRQPELPPGDLVSRILAAAPNVSVGDPWLSWLYPLVVRTADVPFSADDAPFRAGGVPAAFVSDASFSAFYPHYHRPTDVTSEIDPEALARTGEAVLRMIADLAAGPPVARDPRAWLPLGRGVVGHDGLVFLVLLAMLPLVTSPAGWSRLGATILAGAAALATWLDPVVAVVLIAPMGWASSLGWARFAGLLPTVAYGVLLFAAKSRLGGAFDYTGGVENVLVVAVAIVGLVLHRKRTEHIRKAFPKGG